MQASPTTSCAAMTAEFRERLDNGAPLDDLLPEAFAVCREAGRRALAMRHFDVQLIGGMVLHRGSIAEMKTGEGKTLVATLPVYLNALAGKGVHVVTVNDYLARRDAEWMGRIYKFLGLSVGVVVHGQTDDERQQSYRCDITYGTNNEFGFDYLRDNMKVSIERLRAARAELRDRRRGRLDPDRRGAHAAHHHGPGRAVDRQVPEGRRDHPAAAQGQRLHRRREGALGDRSPTTASNASSSGSASATSTTRSTSSRCTSSTRRCARTRSTSATSTTWSRTARCSSSTSSPAACCRAGAGRTACTRRSRPRRTSRSRKRTRRWRRSRSRTSSASTRSSPA